MGFLIRIAWRNIFRNTRRTMLASLAIGVGLASLIFTDALIIGMTESMIRTATDTFLGHGQIHATGFQATMEVEKTVKHLPRLLERLKKEPHVAAFALRALAYGMVSSAANASSVMLYGIDPRAEKRISRLDEAVTSGAFLSEADPRRVLIGFKLAEALEVAVGDRMVVTVAQAGTGQLAQEMFRVGGIYRFNVRDMDGSMAFVPLDEAQTLLGLGDQVHEIALRFDDLQLAGDPSFDFWPRYTQDGNEAQGWKSLMPQLQAGVEISRYTSVIVGGILFAVVALGIMNTLFMSLHERLFEFGVLRAVGTRPLRMGTMVLFEAGALSVTSITVGTVLGSAVTAYFAVRGIDYVGIEFAGVTFRDLIYPVLQPGQFVVFPFWVFVFTLVASLYPAIYAARLAPAEALQTRV